MQALYYTKTLLKDGRLNLDAQNLDTVQQYYLLENLALGLVRDENRATSGYVAGLAKGWLHLDERTWQFELADQLQWSDGSDIDPNYIVSELCALRHSKSRHLRMLHQLEECSLLPGTRTIVMRFKIPVSGWLMHELSLADAVLIHPGNKTGNWTITSGAYSVKSWDSERFEIFLTKNVNFKDSVTNAPEQIRLFWVGNVSELENAFLSLPVDIFPTLANVFSRRQQIMAKNSKEQFWGFPNLLHFFRFNWKNPDTQNQKMRRGLAALVRQATQDWKYGDLLAGDSQFIPAGHEGRLSPDSITEDKDATILKGKQISLVMSNQFKDVPEFSRRLIDVAKSFEVDLHLLDDDTEANQAGIAVWATLYAFKGNQKDALGNWSFLFSQNGPLAPFEKNFEPLFDRILAANNDEIRADLLRQVHLEVIEQALGVPVFFENAAIFSSGKYDLSALNRFDLRPRFFRMARK